MALDKLVDSTQLDADLTSVANAIRTKGGTSAQLAFPQGFVDAVEAIETGGGYEDLYKDIIERNLSGSITVPGIEIVGAGGLSRLPNAVTSAHLQDVVEIGQRSFETCAYLATVVFEKAVNISGQQAFYGSNRLAKFEMGVGSGGIIYNYTFQNVSALNVLILRSTSLVSLLHTNAFNGTKFASGGTGGTLYAPTALVSQYTQATNWSTILGYANNQILPIEGSIYETQYADGTPIE